MLLFMLYVIYVMVSFLPRHSGTINESVFSFCFCQISESGLIEILEKVNQQTEKKTTVKVSSTYFTYFFYLLSFVDLTRFLLCTCQFNRRRVMDSDDEEDDWLSNGVSQWANNQKRILFTGTLIASLSGWIPAWWSLYCGRELNAHGASHRGAGHVVPMTVNMQFWRKSW